ncbi:hypothetical protein BGZ63DRAFT_80892 [Mariannaea sp. PMI_226]|nr:hypothetical protein BGZ63DRAFT_80892 [Mariannaea sp. PMI_226]
MYVFAIFSCSLLILTNTSIVGNPHWPKSIDNIDERLHSLDQCQVEFGSETLLSGPFGLFGSQRHSSEHRARSLFESETEDSAAQPSLGESCAGQIFVYEAGSAQGSAEPSVVGQLNDGSSLSQISSPTWQSGEGVARINGESIEDEKDVENVPRSPELDVGFDTRSLIMHSNLGSTANRHNLISMLMNHYVLNVANILTPFRHPQNTYSSIYASSAMAVAQRIPQGSLSYDSPVSHSKVALVYSLLTSSAFQLRGRDDNTEADILARSFRNQAISHLQLALNSLSGPSPNGSPTNEIFAIAKREEVLSVMLTLITADVSHPPP